MQQVMYANGKIWGALDTALNPGGTTQRAGIAWYIVKPDVSSGSLTAKMALQGYLGAAGSDFAYPTIGVTASGRGVMGFTYSGDSAYPSAAYAPLDAQIGVGPWAVVPGGTGQAADDGFTSYEAQVGNPPRTRWGDYGAAAVDGNHIWIASEYVAHSCDYATWGGPFFAGGSGDNLLGTCARCVTWCRRPDGARRLVDSDQRTDAITPPATVTTSSWPPSPLTRRHRLIPDPPRPFHRRVRPSAGRSPASSASTRRGHGNRGDHAAWMSSIERLRGPPTPPTGTATDVRSD
jgi:hypothetical protein